MAFWQVLQRIKQQWGQLGSLVHFHLCLITNSAACSSSLGSGNASNTGNTILASVPAPSHFYLCGTEDRDSQISCSLGYHWRYVLRLNWACCFNCCSAPVTPKSFSWIFSLRTPWCVRWLRNPWTSEVEHSCDPQIHSQVETWQWQSLWSWEARLGLWAA